MEPASGTMNIFPQLPVVGCPTKLQSFLHDSVGCLRSLHQTYGQLVAFYKGPACSLFAFGPDSNQTVLTNPDVFHLFSGFPGPRNSAHRRFGRGLFGLNGEEHQRQRRLLMPPFRKEAVESYRDVLVSLTEEFLAGWTDRQELDLFGAAKELSLRITSKVLFDVEDLDLAHAIENAFEEWMALNHEIFFAALLPIDCPEGSYDELLRSAQRLEGLLQELVRQKGTAASGRNDLLSLLLRARSAGELSDIDVIGHMHTLFNAAYHTSTSALTWSLFLLIQHPSVMRQLLGELEPALAGGAPTPAQISQLPVLDRVIKESLRILPPVVYAPRTAMQPTDLGPYRLARGTLVVTSHYVTHRLPEIYPQPDRFLPDRWIRAAPSPYACLPFGAGPRMCIGAPFALLMLKTAVPLICQRFRLTVVPGTRIDRRSDLTLSPRGELPVWVRRQDHRFTTSAVEGNIHEILQMPAPDVSTARVA
jgi:cytochrome P450